MRPRLMFLLLVISVFASGFGSDAAPVTPTVSAEQVTAELATPLITNSLGMQLRLIPAGSFVMGSPANEPDRNDDEGPQHAVTLGPFYLGVHEVTVGQYSRFVQGTGRAAPLNSVDPSWVLWTEQIQHPNHPVVNVSWDDAVAFCQWLTQTERQGTYRLPSEAQWEYSCRAGTTTAFNTGSSLSANDARFGQPSDGPADVGSYAPNAWGLCDMHGNVWEWCQDRYHDSYLEAPTDGSAWESDSDNDRVERGGSWVFAAALRRSAHRSRNSRDFRYYDRGFRVSRTP
jgi:formylglycine-generating enzyme required for sulfatase activity